MMKKVRVAMIGFGGIARAHLAAYQILAQKGTPVELIAVCDVDEKKFAESMEINIDTGKVQLSENCHTYTDADEMLAKEDFDMVDICLPTYLHKEYSIRMLRADKHVLVEKPMALNYADCCEMIETAKQTGKRLMVGQCLRFSAEYDYLKKCVDDGKYGRLHRLSMQRLSVLPTWGFENWFLDVDKSGGAILDTHIHDVDMARYLLGEPHSVSTWTEDVVSKWQYVSTRLHYDGATVLAECSWDEENGWRFRDGFRARFERGELVLEDNSLHVYPKDGEPFKADVPQTNHTVEEIAFLVGLILDPTAKNEKNPPESAAATVRLVEKLRESADGNAVILPFQA